MEKNYKDNNRLDKRKPKQKHIYELNGMTMEGKVEGIRKLMRMEFR